MWMLRMEIKPKLPQSMEDTGKFTSPMTQHKNFETQGAAEAHVAKVRENFEVYNEEIMEDKQSGREMDAVSE